MPSMHCFQLHPGSICLANLPVLVMCLEKVETNRRGGSIRFLKYMLSKKVQTRILEETEQIPANKQVVLDSYEKEMPRLFQAASLVLSAEDKIEVPDNLWTYEQKAYFTENIFRELTGKISPEAFTRQLGEMKIDK